MSEERESGSGKGGIASDRDVPLQAELALTFLFAKPERKHARNAQSPIAITPRGPKRSCQALGGVYGAIFVVQNKNNFWRAGNGAAVCTEQQFAAMFSALEIALLAARRSKL
jgi:hypothetical protein